MAHLSLDILRICSSFDDPGRSGRSQATPVYEADSDLSTGWLDVARKDIVIAKRRSLPQRLKHKIIGTIPLHDLVLANGALTAALSFDREPFESMDSLHDASGFEAALKLLNIQIRQWWADYKRDQDDYWPQANT
jgi:hypothetical protein